MSKGYFLVANMLLCLLAVCLGRPVSARTFTVLVSSKEAHSKPQNLREPTFESCVESLKREIFSYRNFVLQEITTLLEGWRRVEIDILYKSKKLLSLPIHLWSPLSVLPLIIGSAEDRVYVVSETDVYTLEFHKDRVDIREMRLVRPRNSRHDFDGDLGLGTVWFADSKEVKEHARLARRNGNEKIRFVGYAGYTQDWSGRIYKSAPSYLFELDPQTGLVEILDRSYFGALDH
ncbi:MAG: hypothetical protein AB7F43_04860 [Bacteriovoracia bacterium]